MTVYVMFNKIANVRFIVIWIKRVENTVLPNCR